MNLFIFVLSGACSGITVLFSQAYGAGYLGTFRRELYQSTLFGALFTLALGALATALLRPLLLVIQTPAELIGYASEYLRIIFAGFLATYAYNLCPRRCARRATRRPRSASSRCPSPPTWGSTCCLWPCSAWA